MLKKLFLNELAVMFGLRKIWLPKMNARFVYGKWGLKPEDIELYLQSFRFAVPPLGGFALGAERMTMHILGLKNIREASLFPRDMERIDIRLSTIQPKSF